MRRYISVPDVPVSPRCARKFIGKSWKEGRHVGPIFGESCKIRDFFKIESFGAHGVCARVSELNSACKVIQIRNADGRVHGGSCRGTFCS